MPTFTSSRYTVSAVTVSGSTTLAQLVEAMKKQRPDHATLTGGWASIADAGSNIRVPNIAPPQSDPEIRDSEAHWPQRVIARYYYFRKDPGLVRANPTGTAQEHHVLDAVDVMINALPGRHDAFQAMFASSNGAILNGLLRSLRDLARADDETASISRDGADLAFSADLILWLLVRARDARELDGYTTIADVLATGARDNVRRTTMLSDGVDFDRPAFLVAVAEIEQLGPVRVELRDEELNAKITADVYPHGAFSIRKRETHYPDIVDDAETRIESLQDFAFGLLPKIKDIYTGDSEWVSFKRAKEIREAAAALIARYEEQIAALDAAGSDSPIE